MTTEITGRRPAGDTHEVLTVQGGAHTVPVVEISSALLAETIEALELLGCQFEFCDGPTLEPVDMVTCYACRLLAQLRVLAGQAPRRDDEMTCEQRSQDQVARFMVTATSGRYR